MTKYTPHPTAPVSTEIKMLDGAFVKSMGLPVAGMFIAQHSHTYDHISVLVRGSVRVTTGDRAHSACYRAPAGILFPAGGCTFIGQIVTELGF